MRPYSLLACALWINLSSLGNAEEASFSDIIPTGGNPHILDTSDQRGPFKRFVATWPKSLPSLGHDLIYDLREQMESCGVRLGPKDLALYSPDTQLIYVRTSRENLDLIKTLFEGHNHGLQGYEVKFIISRGDPNQPFVTFSLANVSGNTAEVTLTVPGTTPAERKLKCEIVVGPDGEAADFNITGRLPILEEDISLSISSTGPIGPPCKIFERIGQTPLRLDLQITPRYTPEQLRQTKEWRAQTLPKIEDELVQ